MRPSLAAVPFHDELWRDLPWPGSKENIPRVKTASMPEVLVMVPVTNRLARMDQCNLANSTAMLVMPPAAHHPSLLHTDHHQQDREVAQGVHGVSVRVRQPG